VFVLTTLSVVAACGGGGDHHEASPTSSSTVVGGSKTITSTAPSTTTTLDPTRTAILAAYRASSSAYYSVATHYPVNPSDPELPVYMAGQELNRVRNALTILAHLGRVLRGPPVDHSMAIVKQLVGDAAVVADCDYDQTTTVDAKTGQVLDKPATMRTLVNAELQLMDGGWKVTRFNIVSHGCAVSA
jgi:hypothetical protein